MTLVADFQKAVPKLKICYRTFLNDPTFSQASFTKSHKHNAVREAKIQRETPKGS